MIIENQEINNKNNAEIKEKDPLKELSEKEFEIWNEALLSNDPEKIASLYDKNASFLPTFNPDFKKIEKELKNISNIF